MNRIANVIEELTGGKFKFIPDREFYETVNIGQKRWAKILRNEVSPTLDETNRIAKFFNVSISELIQD